MSSAGLLSGSIMLVIFTFVYIFFLSVKQSFAGVLTVSIMLVVWDFGLRYSCVDANLSDPTLNTY